MLRRPPRTDDVGHRDHDGVRRRARGAVAARLAPRARTRRTARPLVTWCGGRHRSHRPSAPTRRDNTRSPSDQPSGLCAWECGARSVTFRPGAGRGARPGAWSAYRSRTQAPGASRTPRPNSPHPSRCSPARSCSSTFTAIGRASFGSEYARIVPLHLAHGRDGVAGSRGRRSTRSSSAGERCCPSRVALLVVGIPFEPSRGRRRATAAERCCTPRPGSPSSRCPGLARRLHTPIVTSRAADRSVCRHRLAPRRCETAPHPATAVHDSRRGVVGELPPVPVPNRRSGSHDVVLRRCASRCC